MDDTRSILKQLGLNEKEVTLYLMLLRVGTAPASALSERTGIHRSTAQYTCKQLVKKRLATVSRKGGTLLYAADTPEKLFSLLQTEQDKVDGKKMRVKQVLGTLKAMRNPIAALPSVRFFEGPQGIVSAYKDLLHDVGHKKEILWIVQPLDEKDDAAGVLPVLRDCIDLRMKMGIRSRVLAPKTGLGILMQQRDAEKMRETRLIAPSAFPTLASEIVIAGDTIYTMTLDGHSALVAVLESPALAHMQRMLFEIAWASAGPQQ